MIFSRRPLKNFDNHSLEETIVNFILVLVFIAQQMFAGMTAMTRTFFTNITNLLNRVLKSLLEDDVTTHR